MMLTFKNPEADSPETFPLSPHAVNDYSEWNQVVDHGQTIAYCYRPWPWTKWLSRRKRCNDRVTAGSYKLIKIRLRGSFWTFDSKRHLMKTNERFWVVNNVVDRACEDAQSRQKQSDKRLTNLGKCAQLSWSIYSFCITTVTQPVFTTDNNLCQMTTTEMTNLHTYCAS